jgi:hypothetical protein
MYIEIDLASVPPVTALHDGENFKEFKIVAARSEHAYVSVDRLAELAGELGDSAEWREQLDQMIAYAQSKGWVREDGAVRAHIDWST